jgi:hypothetical protein
MGKGLQMAVGALIALGFVVWKHTATPGHMSVAQQERMHRTMVHGCRDSALGRSMETDVGQEFCDCTIEKMVADHGYDKIDQAMVDDPAKQPAWLQDAMLDSAKHCAAKMDLDIQIQPH